MFFSSNGNKVVTSCSSEKYEQTITGLQYKLATMEKKIKTMGKELKKFKRALKRSKGLVFRLRKEKNRLLDKLKKLFGNEAKSSAASYGKPFSIGIPRNEEVKK